VTINHTRVVYLIREAIQDFGLDLTDLTVYTEAAIGYPGYAPIIAAMAGAKKVFAITKDSNYGRKEEVSDFTYTLARSVNVEDRIEVIYERNSDEIAQADIITNTGFVRPIDRWMVENMKKTACVLLMMETWEHRPEDVDLVACRENNILVMGTNENDPRLKIFDYLGALCAKQLLNCDIEIVDSKLRIVGSGYFSYHIARELDAFGAQVLRVNTLNNKKALKFLKNADAIIIADDTPERLHIGEKGDITAKELWMLSPHITVLQLKGLIDRKDLDKYAIPYLPKEDRGKGHMGFILDDLGPKPSIRLLVAGLKVGEAMARARLAGKSIEEAKKFALENSPAQDFTEVR